MLPLWTLMAEHREFGLVVAVLLGFGFGFTLERAGFGRADKLAAQFYLHDMTVFKVMFTAIITAMLGVMGAAGLGVVELSALSQSAVSYTYLWPQLVGGLLLGVGFIVSGYCPGTSLVASASGNIDGMMTFLGVIAGSVLFGELQPALASFHVSGELGHVFLYDLLGVSPQLLAVGVTIAAILMFLGAEKVEAIFTRRRTGEPAPAPARQPRRFAFGALGGLIVLALVTVAFPTSIGAKAVKKAQKISQPEMAHRVLEKPWQLRVIDLRPRETCAKQRIPGSECVPLADLTKLGLAYSDTFRDLVLVGEEELKQAPAPALEYGGEVLILEGGFAGWRKFALTPPALPATDASESVREGYRFRASLNAAMTGRKPPPPPPANKGYAPKPRKKKGGGCS